MAKYRIKRNWVSATDLGTDIPWVPTKDDVIKVRADGYDLEDGFFTFYNDEGETVFVLNASVVESIRRKP